MGHYLSEMTSDEEAQENLLAERKLRARRVEKLKAMIVEYGLEEALVRLFEDDYPRRKLGY